MTIDNTLARIITETQKATAKEFGIDLTFEQVHEVIEVQLTSTVYALTKNIPIHWRGFLKFLWTNKRARKEEIKSLFNAINEKAPNLTDKEISYYTYLAGVASSAAKQEAERLSRHSKAISTEEVKALPTKVEKFRQFTCLIKQR